MEKEYDYLILGTGNSALVLGALLANAGHTVCMLEAHDIPGGYAQTFPWGEYKFCGQVHYIWGCGPGGKIYEFLKKIGLEKDITFELLDPKTGYDHMVMPDGTRVPIPYGFDRLAGNIENVYPGEGKKVAKFTGILSKIRTELRRLPERKIHRWEYLAKSWQFPALLRYRTKTLQNVFDECGLSREAQAVLIANAGDLMAPPNELSIFAYDGLFGGYNTGAYYPTKHFKYYVDRIVKFITDHQDCRIYYNAEVVKINTEGSRVTSVELKDGRKFTGKTIVSNIDPQATAKMIGLEKFPKALRKKLNYRYSPSGVTIYLGLKDLDLRKYGFGSYNIWHLGQWDMNKMWDEQKRGDFSNPWFFISTHTLHTKDRSITPPNGEIMEIATYTEYQEFKDLQNKNYELYEKRKNEIAERLIDIVEKKYIPELRKHIAVKVIGSPTTNEDFVRAPRGNAYGAYLSPKLIGTGRLTFDTPWKNFYWCNATAGYGGIHGTTGNGIQLYINLTGDKFYDAAKAPTDDDFVAAIRKNFS
jgi:all-trans-retinol 13,14-reductase